MTYRVYLTVEMPGEYDTKDAAADAAVKALQDAVTSPTDNVAVAAQASLNLMRGRPMEARVFQSHTITNGVDHLFIVDIHDGAI